ncbi:MAG: glycosyl hydrolase [Candidatus Margulisbacteria bacterium]|nr:glycosyl hydrolase [Candidatus Margulisiibacteriota bacterium]
MPNGVYQGVRLGDSTLVSTQAINNFASLSATDVDFVELEFSSFRPDRFSFPSVTGENAAQTGATLLIKFQPAAPQDTQDKPLSLSDIVSGQYVKELEAFAGGTKNFGRPLFLSLAHERKNGNPELYKRAFQYLHDLFDRQGACNVTWVWNPDDSPAAKQFYPGDKYVDWIAVDGFNRTDSGLPWRKCPDIFTHQLDELRSLGKPLMIQEFASDENTPEDEMVRKPAWLSECVSYIADPNNQIKAFAYFNQNKTENRVQNKQDNWVMKRWALRSPEAWGAYRQGIKDHEELFKSRILYHDEIALSPAPSGSPDNELGDIGPEERPLLDEKKIKALFQRGELDIKSIETILASIVDQSRKAEGDFRFLSQGPHDFVERFGDLQTIAKIDRRQKHELYWYFADPREFWNNTIVLLSAYMQECMETGRADKLPKINDWTVQLISKLNAQERESKIKNLSIVKNDWTRDLPTDFGIALLHFIKAEAHSQMKGQSEAFYKEGIKLAEKGLLKIFSLKDKPLYPSLPDYFMVAKGILILGDLFSQLAHLTKNQDYYLTAFDLYRRVSEIDEARGIDLNYRLKTNTIAKALIPAGQFEKVRSLFVDPSAKYLVLKPGIGAGEIDKLNLAGETKQRLKQALDISIDLVPFSADAQAVNKAVKYNIDRNYIKPEKKDQILAGFYHYQKGIGLLKQAALFVSWPRLKQQADVVAQINNIEAGLSQLNTAMKKTGENQDRELFVSSLLCQLTSTTLTASTPLQALGLSEDNFKSLLERLFNLAGTADLQQLVNNDDAMNSWADGLLNDGIIGAQQRTDLLPALRQALTDPVLVKALTTGFDAIDRRLSSFYLTMGQIVEGELLLLLSDRIRYYPENVAENQKAINYLRHFPALAASLDQAEKTLNQQYKYVIDRSDFDIFGDRRDEVWLAIWKLYPWIINGFSMVDPTLNPARLNNFGADDKNKILDIFRQASNDPYSIEPKNRIRYADILVAAVRDSFFPGINPRFSYLHTWSRIKQLEIDIRNAGYVVELNDRRLPYNIMTDFSRAARIKADPTAQLAEADDIIRQLAPSNIGDTEYLGVEFDFIRVIYQLAGMPRRGSHGVYLSGINKLDPAATLALITRIRDNYLDFNEEDKLYFEVQLNIREAGALIQQRQFDRALQVLRDTERRIAPPLSSHITDKLHQVSGYLAKGVINDQTKEAIQKILDVTQILLKNKGDINTTTFIVAEDKRPFIQDALIAAGCVGRQGIVQPNFLSLQGQFAQKLAEKNIYLTTAETDEVFSVLGRANAFVHLRQQAKTIIDLFNQNDLAGAVKAMNGSIDRSLIPPDQFDKVKELFNDPTLDNLTFRLNLKKEDINKVDIPNELKFELRQALNSGLLPQLDGLDNSIGFERRYGERLTLDLHSFRAELYHFMAVANNLSREADKKVLHYEYAQSAYFESRRSTIKYDLFFRPTFLSMDFPEISDDLSTF